MSENIDTKRIGSISRLLNDFPCNRCISYVGDPCPEICPRLDVKKLNEFLHRVNNRIEAQWWELDLWDEEEKQPAQNT